MGSHAHDSHLQCQGDKLFFLFCLYEQETKTLSVTSQQSHLLFAELYIHKLQDYMLTLKMSSEKYIKSQGHQPSPEEHSDEISYLMKHINRK